MIIIFLFRKVYVCHHSGFNKVCSKNNKRGRSKNTECNAKIEIKIKLTTKDTKKKDKFVRVSLYYKTVGI